MAYQKQKFTNNSTVLTAEIMEHIEAGIVAIEKALETVQKAVEELTVHGVTARIGNVTLLADNWEGTASPYSQRVTLEGVTKNSQVDLTPSVEQLTIFHDKDIAFVAENEGGVVTVYAVGQKPTNNYTIQVTITEVAV